MTKDSSSMTVGKIREKLKNYRDDAKIIVEHYCPDAPHPFTIKGLDECSSGSGDWCIIKINDKKENFKELQND